MVSIKRKGKKSIVKSKLTKQIKGLKIIAELAFLLASAAGMKSISDIRKEQFESKLKEDAEFESRYHLHC
jgi:tRNA U34 5-carboxymethylaminomethyl modifying GTPase MnmE/TrmE